MSLTKSDLQNIREIFSDEFDKAHLKLRDDVANFKDQIVSELKKLREEVTVVGGYKDQIEEHETRVTSLETSLKSS